MADNNANDVAVNVKKEDLIVTCVFDAPVEEIWQAWSDPEYVMRWWGPAGFTSPRAEMDFRVGGASLVYMRASAEYGGQDMYHTWTHTNIDPHERIEFEGSGRQVGGNAGLRAEHRRHPCELRTA